MKDADDKTSVDVILPPDLPSSNDYYELRRQSDIQLVISPMDALCLLGTIQLALRHPKNIGPSSKVAREFAKRLEERIAINDRWKNLCAMGWDSQFDL